MWKCALFGFVFVAEVESCNMVIHLWYFIWNIKYHSLFHIEDLSLNGTPSQSSDYYWKDRKINLTAELAINGETDDTFGEAECSVTQYSPRKYVAWWMLTFPVDTVYITNVQINYRNDNSKCSVLSIHFNWVNVSNWPTYFNIRHYFCNVSNNLFILIW
jgi:hypothetical protein